MSPARNAAVVETRRDDAPNWTSSPVLSMVPETPSWEPSIERFLSRCRWLAVTERRELCMNGAQCFCRNVSTDKASACSCPSRPTRWTGRCFPHRRARVPVCRTVTCPLLSAEVLLCSVLCMASQLRWVLRLKETLSSQSLNALVPDSASLRTSHVAALLRCVGISSLQTIQPGYGYGSHGAPPSIPGNAVLKVSRAVCGRLRGTDFGRRASPARAFAPRDSVML